MTNEDIDAEAENIDVQLGSKKEAGGMTRTKKGKGGYFARMSQSQY